MTDEAIMTPDRIETLIEPARGFLPIIPRDLWSYRELLWQLVMRNVLVRYKQAVMGMLWAILTPLLTALLFTVIFGFWGGLPSDGIPKAPFYLSGLTLYLVFSGSLTACANSMVQHRGLLTKVYFPRIIIPLSATAVSLVDFVWAFAVLVGIVLYNGYVPRVEIFIALPLCLLWVWATAFGLGLWFAALNVYYRDAGQIVPLITRLGMFASPILYPVSMIPERWHWLYGLNPLVGVIEWLRFALFRATAAPDPVFFASALVSLTLLATGGWYFRRMEHNYADVV